MTNYIIEYDEAIKHEEIIVPKHIKEVISRCRKQVDDPIPNHYFNLKKATSPILFAEMFCKQSQGTMGEPIKLLLWQKAIIQILFGFLHKETDKRQYREAFVLIARKNGKSTFASILSLYMLIADYEGSAEIYSVATKLDQSKRIVTEAWNMVSQSKDLYSSLRKRRNDIYCEINKGTMTALASSSKSMDGLNTHFGVVDEAHAIRDRELYDVIKQSMQSRRQPLMLTITTAGTVRENIYDNLYEYSVSVAEGKVQDDAFLPILYELDSIEEWDNEEMWIKANPSLGSVKLVEALRSEVERATKDPNYLSGVLCKHFNMRQTGSNLWLTFEEINNTKTYTELEMSDKYCIGGVDLSSTTDLTCATILTKEWKTGELLIKQMYWLPEDRLQERILEDKVPYDKWAERGFLRISAGNKVDYHNVTQWFLEQVHDYGLRPLWVGYDSWNANYWKDEMEDNGFEMIEVRQGAKTMSTPMKELKADLGAKLINYNNNPILKWCLTNTSVKRDDNDNIRPIKGRSSRARIDGVVSLIDCYVLYYNKYQDFNNMIGE